MEVMVKMRFGSHLYGTATPESDQDFKGIFIPSMRDLVLGTVPKSKRQNTKTDNSRRNTKADVDCEFYSIQYFLQLAKEGQTVALDMLHAPADMLITTSAEWEALFSLRTKFYTRNLNAFVGYARRQASKYGLKGSRLASAKEVLESLLTAQENGYIILDDVWGKLPTPEHVYQFQDANGRWIYQICGKKFHDTVKIKAVIPVIEHFLLSFGSRAEEAAKNQNVDWKAISHAVRAADEVKQILLDGRIVFPLEIGEFLRDIKQGKLSYDLVSDELESRIAELEVLSGKSELPAHVDDTTGSDFLLSIYKERRLV